MDGAALLLERTDRRFHAGSNRRVQAVAEVFFGDADAQPFYRAVASRFVRSYGHVCTSGVMAIAARNDLQQARGAPRIARERAHLIQARSKRDQSIARDAAVARLYAHDAAEGSRLPNRAAGVAAEGACSHSGGDSHRAPTAGAPGGARRIPGVF